MAHTDSNAWTDHKRLISHVMTKQALMGSFCFEKKNKITAINVESNVPGKRHEFFYFLFYSFEWRLNNLTLAMKCWVLQKKMMELSVILSQRGNQKGRILTIQDGNLSCNPPRIKNVSNLCPLGVFWSLLNYSYSLLTALSHITMLF